MGRRKWKLYQETVLRSWCPSIEREIEIKDWDPSEDKCSFCDLEPSGKVTDEEPVSPLQSECYGTTANNNNHIELLEGDESDSNSVSSAEDSIPTMNALDNMTVCHAAIAALTRSGGAPNPLLYQPGVFPSLYLTQPPKPLLDGIVKNEPSMVMSLPASAGTEMPLDLSAKSSKPPPTESPDNIRSPNMIDNKPMMKGRSRMSPMTGSRRAYTESELQAALRDIQSGKLGTRRAAVIYGIPRSTLRNKVYKLALERERDNNMSAPRLSPPDGAASSPSLPANPDKEDSSADDEKDAESAKSRLSFEDFSRLPAVDGSQADGLGLLLYHFSRLQAKGVNMMELLSSEHSPFEAHLTQLLKLKENGSPDNEKSKRDEGKEEEEAAKEADDATSQDSTDKAKYSSMMLSELMRHFRAEQRLPIEEQLKRKMASENGVDDDQSSVILRIPSFKPNASCSKSNSCDPEARYATSPAGASQENSRHSVVSPSLNGDSESPPAGKTPASVKDAVAKGIGQKFQQDGIGHPLASPGLGQEAMDALAKRGGFALGLPPQHAVHKNHFDRSQSRPQHASAQTNAQGKGTRPKRGKYRNYDRDSLVEAVRAVQRGEMSVHRAGSYYGVPHSTLEYKVKERHLMRPRKREPKGEDKAKLTPACGGTAAAADKPKQLPLAPKPSVPKTSYPNPAALPNGLKIPPNIFETGVSTLAYSGSPFSFWPPSPFPSLQLDMSRGAFTPEQLFAQQMMRGNLEASQSPSTLPPAARRIVESLYVGSGNNGSFLDGIIRSSLEMGPTASQKHDKDSEKSGKNTEKMSNKALLDQLCRNSRLTPVPRPSGESISDDEAASRNVPYDLSRSSDDEDRKSTASRHRRSSKSGDAPDPGEEKTKSRSLRSSVSEENNRSKASSDADQDVPSPDDLQNLDEDIDNISNHASDEEDAKDS
ncbi:UNVERIFIED_CONTAM: hypothetical protein PYX00_004144 [Menopon gallinae]|uniref:HTH psq-type domain-containing protein n=1 Tax=Menopon gallinae TaxID=328185 RepID=A0AAW2I3G1_9NEOP